MQRLGSTARRLAVTVAVVGASVLTTNWVAAASDDPAPSDPVEVTGAADASVGAVRQLTFVDHAYPVAAGRGAYGTTHHDYPATDIAVSCGTPVLAPVDGAVWEAERIDRWSPSSDVPSTRGGRTVVVEGDDGVRYLLAHLSTIDTGLAVGQRVEAGAQLGTVGSTGRSTGCHLHVGFSPPCATRVWDRLAGTVWPYPYLDLWRRGENLSPGPEIVAWSAKHPGGCSPGAIVDVGDQGRITAAPEFGE